MRKYKPDAAAERAQIVFMIKALAEMRRAEGERAASAGNRDAIVANHFLCGAYSKLAAAIEEGTHWQVPEGMKQ
jgi:hypothetical protein